MFDTVCLTRLYIHVCVCVYWLYAPHVYKRGMDPNVSPPGAGTGAWAPR